MREQNPYKPPQDAEPPPYPKLDGIWLAKDTAKLLFTALLVSVVVVPPLFILIAVVYGILQYFGIPLPNQ